MILRNFYINIVLRLVLIFLSGLLFLLIYQLLSDEYLFALLVLGTILIIQVILLGRFVNQINHDLTRFFSAVRTEDSTLVFKEVQENKYFRNLYKSMNDLNEKFMTTRAEYQKQSVLLNNIVSYIGIGLILYYDNGEVMMINHAAKDLLKVSSLSNISNLQNIHVDLYTRIYNIQPGKPEIVRLIHHTQEQGEQGIVNQLLLKKDIIKTEDKTINTLSIQNIVKEMERKELDSWQKLIHVLTHEIMNSISPILSLTRSITKYYADEKENLPISPKNITDHIVNKTLSGLHTITDTGEGLIDFVGKYRTLTRLPEPQFAPFKINILFARVQELMQEEVDKNNISFTVAVTRENLELVADINQLEKVLINLVKNSIEALSKEAHSNIRMEAESKENAVIIQVEDNGPGIPPEIMDDIFVPFFTTKSKGSGIGLSISRQIVLNHEGTISVHSIKGEKTVFTLKF